jgi:DNA-directed RNA polymerase subunit beta
VGDSNTKIKTNKIIRRDYSKVSGSLELPHLVEIQTSSYKDFIENGIDEVFKDVFPIQGPGDLELEYVSNYFEDEKYGLYECKNRDLTYAAPLKVVLRLHNKATGEITDGEVFMGDFPKMTESGTFIINGAERVIVSQLVRSPGAYFKKALDKNGKIEYSGDIIPSRGTWLEFKHDPNKDIINVSIDRTRKLSAVVLFKALGLVSLDSLINLFGKNKYLIKTFENTKTNMGSVEAMVEIYSRLRPGEPATEESAKNSLIQKLFDPKRYDLLKAGRFKFKKKLSVYNRLRGRYIAEDLVDVNGVVLYKKGTYIDKEIVNKLKEIEFFEQGAHRYTIPEIKTELEEENTVNIVKVYIAESEEDIIDNDDHITNIVGTDLTIEKKYLTIPDIIAAFSYLLNITEGFGDTDDIDHLGNRRVRTVGELLQNQFRIGLSRMERSIKEKMSIADATNLTPKQLTNIKPLTSAIKEFFSSSQLSQFMDQTNPLAELTNKRRLSALGPGGLTRERAGMEVRDVHHSHYGRICPIETPEGPNIGLINNLATYARVNEYGFIETPYRKVEKEEVNGQIICRVLEDTEYLSADLESEYVIAQANINIDDETKQILDETVVARFRGDNIMAKREDVDYVDVSPKQIVSVATACIPFLENDDAKRALMGANMQRQAIPLLRPQAPLVGTGMENIIAKDSGAAIISDVDGIVRYVDSKRIIIEPFEKTLDNDRRVYYLQKFNRSNQGTCINQNPIVKVGDKVQAGEIIADGPAMEKGDLALGQNVIVAFMTWHGYNYEDAVIMSERLVKDDVYTSIHIEEYSIECRDTKLGPEEITRDIPGVSENAKANLDAEGIIVPGAEVKEKDILVGKITPKGQTEPTPEEKLLMAIFGEKTKEGKDNSLRIPHGGAGIVLDVKKFSREAGDELPPGVNRSVRVYVAQKRKISEGDKMAGRHGNKGVISRILPVEDMPFLPDGTPVDIMLNPLGVPSRMNIGQVLELHLGMAAKKLGIHVASPVFDGVMRKDLDEIMKEAGMSEDGKITLYDGLTGQPFEEKVSVGIMYMIKLSHMVDDKLHARSIGPYSLVTQQPLGGKAQNGGQRFGEMEVWALEAYGAAHTLQEILTVKSDDMIGRQKTYEAVIKGQPIPKPGIPESFSVLQKELQALAIDVKLIDKHGEQINISEEMEEELNQTNNFYKNMLGEKDSQSNDKANKGQLDSNLDDELSDVFKEQSYSTEADIYGDDSEDSYD